MHPDSDLPDMAPRTQSLMGPADPTVTHSLHQRRHRPHISRTSCTIASTDTRTHRLFTKQAPLARIQHSQRPALTEASTSRWQWPGRCNRASEACRVAKAVDPVISQGGAAAQAAFRVAAGRALTACGLHIAAGGHLHAMICEAETEHAAAAIEAHGAGSAEAQEAVSAACDAWERWATAPVIGTADALDGYRQWLQALPDALRRAVPDRIPKVTLPPRMPLPARHPSHQQHACSPCAFASGLTNTTCAAMRCLPLCACVTGSGSLSLSGGGATCMPNSLHSTPAH